MRRICRNHITDQIRDQFGANPLRVPEVRIQPMSMLEVQKNKAQFLGEFKYLVQGGFDEEVPQKMDPVSNVSDSKSKAIDFEVGFDILSGFLKALNIDTGGVSTSFQVSKKMAFAFSNVRRSYIDPLFLGSLLSQKQVMADVNNFVLEPIIKETKIKLGLITDVIVSNNFSVSTFSESESAVALDIPTIAEAVGAVNTSVKVTKKGENEVQFEGPADLTFAFSCLELTIDPQSGRFGRGEWFNEIRDRSAAPFGGQIPEEEAEDQQVKKMVFDEDHDHPLMIEL